MIYALVFCSKSHRSAAETEHLKIEGGVIGVWCLLCLLDEGCSMVI